MPTAKTKVVVAAELRSMSRHRLDEILSSIKADVGTFERIGGEDLGGLDNEQMAEMEQLVDFRKAVQAEFDVKNGEATALKAKLKADVKGDDGASAGVRRPNLGGQDSGGGGGSAVETDTIEPGDSQFDKFMERGPFKSFTHFAVVTKAWCTKNPSARPKDASRLVDEWLGHLHQSEASIKAAYGDVLKDVKAATGMNEFIDSEGGLLIPTEYSQGIWSRSIDGGMSLMAMCDRRTVTGNTWVMRAFQDKSRADGSRWGGVQGYWESEAQQHTTTKPTFRALPTRLGKCVVMIHATEEQLEDTTGLEADLSRVAADEIRFQVNRAIFTGTGNGWPLGLLNAGAKITQAAVSGQGVNTVVAQNVDEMWARRADGAGTNYVWLANQEIEPQLAKLNYSVTNTGAVWTYLPGGYMGPGQAAPMPATLKGRQVHYIEQAKALGTEGDLVLWDPTQYVVVTKATGVKQAISTHLRFDYDEVVFKFSFRMDGRPYWDAPLTRYSGTNSLSPIVTLNSTRT